VKEELNKDMKRSQKKKKRGRKESNRNPGRKNILKSNKKYI
jgi:hypothetical protein